MSKEYPIFWLYIVAKGFNVSAKETEVKLTQPRSRHLFMHIFRSKSFFFLVLNGLAVVSLPLIVVLISSDILMGKLAENSSYSVYRSVTSSKLSQALGEDLLNEERRARQYDVLGDKNLLDEARKNHIEIQATLTDLNNLLQNKPQNEALNRLMISENLLFSKLLKSPANSEKYHKALAGFTELHNLNQEISQLLNTQTYDEITSMEKEASHAKRILFWQALTLLPLTILLILFFTRLISRPIKEITAEVMKLGKGDFNTPISVKGPEDLVLLGERLNWLREKLAMYEKEKNKFSAHVSHELKTPLASIREASELLADEVAGPINKQQQEIVSILKKNSLQLQELIENLLGYTMAQAKKAHLNIRKFPLIKLVENVLLSYKPIILKKKITLEISIPEITLSGDIEYIRIMIDNLLSNALKYSPPAKTIKVQAEQNEAMVNIDVIDYGPGILSAETDKIFQPFFQGSIPTKSSIKGTGLGLAIASEYAIAHGGALTLIEQNTKGAHFRISIPSPLPLQTN